MLGEVRITNNAVYSCCVHALSTEKEEVMGLLLGQVRWRADGMAIAFVWGAKLLLRVDKRPDRVEISPEALMEAVAAADEMSAALGMETRVIGWYHSHPKITMLPSHVDLRSQGSYQGMDSSWVGLIFSVYSVDTHLTNRVHIHCFQSSSERAPHPLVCGHSNTTTMSQEWQRVAVPVRVTARHDIHQDPVAAAVPLYEPPLALTQTLLMEEATSYQAGRGGTSPACPLRTTFCSSVYAKNTTRILSCMAGPYLSDVRDSVIPSLTKRIAKLDEFLASADQERQHLLTEIREEEERIAAQVRPQGDVARQEEGESAEQGTAPQHQEP